MNQWLNGQSRPTIEILSRAEIGGRGAYAERNHTIYLAREVLLGSIADDVAALYLEELGHAFDAQLNPSDSPGDEGAIFAALVQGQPLNPAQLEQLQSETDTSIRTINGQTLTVEHQNGTGLKATYYDNPDFSNPVLERIDAQIDFDWQQGSPDPAMHVDHFSMRWEGQLEARYSEDYTLITNSDEAIRVWLDGKLIIDNWVPHGTQENRSSQYLTDNAPLSLVAGQKYDIKIEYAEYIHGATVQLLWESASQVQEVIPQAFLYEQISLPAGVEANGNGLKASYYDNSDFTHLVLERTDAQINFNWEGGSPHSTIGNDHFSARWSGQLEIPQNGNYTFITESDEAIRVWLDNQLVIDHWAPHGWAEDRGVLNNLVAGQKYDLQIEYAEYIHSAALRLLWEATDPHNGNQIILSEAVIPQDYLYSTPVPATLPEGQGLIATYYDNRDFSNPVLERIDPNLDFTWWNGTPDPALHHDHFSVRWEGQLEALYSEDYTFYTESDEGVRVWVNGQKIIDNWTPHGPQENSASQYPDNTPISLVAGQRYDIRVDYYEGTNDASLKLLWESASQAKGIIPSEQFFAIVPPLPSGVEGSGTGLRAAYYNDGDFGQPALERIDAHLDFSWGNGRPDPAIHHDTFSVRWQGQLEAPATEDYTFITQSDEKVRVWVDDQLVIDHWNLHGLTEDSGSPITLTAGEKYNIRVDYYEEANDATLKLLWESDSRGREIIPQRFLYATAPTLPTGVEGSGNGLKGEYFHNSDFTNPVLVRSDEQIGFNWYDGSPDGAIHADTFSVRWTGEVEALYDEVYTFITQSDEGVRLWVNDQLIIDHWGAHNLTENSGDILLAAGQKYDIQLEYYEGSGDAQMKLLWESDSQVRELVPEAFLYHVPLVSDEPGGSTSDPGSDLEPGVEGAGEGLLGEYFDEGDLLNPVLTRVDGQVDFDWGEGSPDAAIAPDQFRVWWSGEVEIPTSGDYTFYLNADEDVALWIDGQLLINTWDTWVTGEQSATVTGLVAGQRYEIDVSYYDEAGVANVELAWESANRAKEVIPQAFLYASDHAGSIIGTGGSSSSGGDGSTDNGGTSSGGGDGSTGNGGNAGGGSTGGNGNGGTDTPPLVVGTYEDPTIPLVKRTYDDGQYTSDIISTYISAENIDNGTCGCGEIVYFYNGVYEYEYIEGTRQVTELADKTVFIASESGNQYAQDNLSIDLYWDAGVRQALNGVVNLNDIGYVEIELRVDGVLDKFTKIKSIGSSTQGLEDNSGFLNAGIYDTYEVPLEVDAGSAASSMNVVNFLSQANSIELELQSYDEMFAAEGGIENLTNDRLYGANIEVIYRLYDQNEYQYISGLDWHAEQEISDSRYHNSLAHTVKQNMYFTRWVDTTTMVEPDVEIDNEIIFNEVVDGQDGRFKTVDYFLGNTLTAFATSSGEFELPEPVSGSGTVSLQHSSPKDGSTLDIQVLAADPEQAITVAQVETGEIPTTTLEPSSTFIASEAEGDQGYDLDIELYLSQAEINQLTETQSNGDGSSSPPLINFEEIDKVEIKLEIDGPLGDFVKLAEGSNSDTDWNNENGQIKPNSRGSNGELEPYEVREISGDNIVAELKTQDWIKLVLKSYEEMTQIPDEEHHPNDWDKIVYLYGANVRVSYDMYNQGGDLIHTVAKDNYLHHWVDNITREDTFADLSQEENIYDNEIHFVNRNGIFNSATIYYFLGDDYKIFIDSDRTTEFQFPGQNGVFVDSSTSEGLSGQNTIRINRREFDHDSESFDLLVQHSESDTEEPELLVEEAIKTPSFKDFMLEQFDKLMGTATDPNPIGLRLVKELVDREHYLEEGLHVHDHTVLITPQDNNLKLTAQAQYLSSASVNEGDDNPKGGSSTHISMSGAEETLIGLPRELSDAEIAAAMSGEDSTHSYQGYVDSFTSSDDADFPYVYENAGNPDPCKGSTLETPTFLILAHELIHARHAALGIMRQHDHQSFTTPYYYKNLEEEATIALGNSLLSPKDQITENDIRGEHGLGVRRGHSGGITEASEGLTARIGAKNASATLAASEPSEDVEPETEEWSQAEKDRIMDVLRNDSGGIVIANYTPEDRFGESQFNTGVNLYTNSDGDSGYQ